MELGLDKALDGMWGLNEHHANDVWVRLSSLRILCLLRYSGMQGVIDPSFDSWIGRSGRR